MEQLKMRWKRQEVKPVHLPDGFTVRNFTGTDADIDSWLTITQNGLLSQDATHENYITAMVDHPDLDINYIFIIENEGAGVATVTPIVHANKRGYVHMVACKPAYRGLGIGNALISIALRFLVEADCENVDLTTDDFRLPAIKSYITAGFLPVLYADTAEMETRWTKVMKVLAIDTLEAVDEEGNFLKIIVREQ